jgi:phosphoribosylaminoimidazole-succinocarboxamide synthase
MLEHQALAKDNALPIKELMQVCKTYINIAEKITGQSFSLNIVTLYLASSHR